MNPLQLQKKLQYLLKKKVVLTLKNNRSVWLRARKSFFCWEITLHSVFLKAEEQQLQALKDMLLCKNKKNSLAKGTRQCLKNFLSAQLKRKTQDFPGSVKKINIRNLKPAGQYHDLQQIYDFLNGVYFKNTLDLKITWRKTPVYKKYRHITFGSFNRDLKLIRINSLLDSPEVPFYFVGFVVYHEMLHHVYPVKMKKNKRQIHFKEFKEAEKKFLQYGQAKKFKEKFVKGQFYGRT